LLKQSRRQGSHSINRSGTARCARKWAIFLCGPIEWLFTEKLSVA
jgi:hypothetical protein